MSWNDWFWSSVRNEPKYIPLPDIELGTVGADEYIEFEAPEVESSFIESDFLLEEVLSTAPDVLASGVVALEGGGFVSTTGGLTVATLAALGGATIVAGGVSYIVKKANLATVPFHPNTGLNEFEEPSANTADAISKVHDKAYEKATKFKDVHKADIAFVKDQTSNFLETGNPASILGAAVIGTKHLFEKHTGIHLYPNLDKNSRNMSENKKRKLNDQQSNQQSADVSSTSEGTQQDATKPGEGGSGAGSTSNESGPITLVDRPICYDNFQTWRFKKVHKMLSYGLGYANLALDAGVIDRVMVTPFMEVPWDKLYFYLSGGEQASLPIGARVLTCSISIVQRNTRVAFDTGESLSQLATFNQNKFGVLGLALNQKVQGRTCNVTADVNMNVTVASTIVPNTDYALHDLDLYGVGQTDIVFNTQIPTHQFGLRTNPPFYFGMTAPDAIDAISIGGWANMDEHVKEWDMNTTVGTVVHQQSYNFQYAPVTTNLPTVVNETLSTKAYAIGSEDKQQNRLSTTFFPPNATTASVATIAEVTYTSGVGTVPTRFELMEQGQRIRSINMGYDGCRAVQPTVHIGVKSIPALAFPSHAPPTAFANVQAYWEITAECTIGTPNPHTYTNSETFHTTYASMPFRRTGTTGASINNLGSLYYGRYNEV